MSPAVWIEKTALGTVKKALEILVDELREDDRVGIVVYAGGSGRLLDPTPVSNKETIMNIINSTTKSGGSTNLGRWITHWV